MIFNSTIAGTKFSEETVQAVWEKGQIVPNNDKNIFRKDQCGAWIQRNQYGNIDSQYGWEIDHKKPKSKGGSDHLSNLQPLQWENNRYKSDNYPNWYCKVK